MGLAYRVVELRLARFRALYVSGSLVALLLVHGQSGVNI